MTKVLFTSLLGKYCVFRVSTFNQVSRKVDNTERNDSTHAIDNNKDHSWIILRSHTRLFYLITLRVFTCQFSNGKSKRVACRRNFSTLELFCKCPYCLMGYQFLEVDFIYFSHPESSFLSLDFLGPLLAKLTLNSANSIHWISRSLTELCQERRKICSAEKEYKYLFSYRFETVITKQTHGQSWPRASVTKTHLNAWVMLDLFNYTAFMAPLRTLLLRCCISCTVFRRKCDKTLTTDRKITICI